MEVSGTIAAVQADQLPAGWAAVRLGDFARFRTGPFGSTLHQHDYVDDGVPVINPMQIVDGRLVPTPSMSVSESMARHLSEFRLSAGDVVIGRRGEMGRCACVAEQQQGWLCGTGSLIIRVNAQADPRFIQRQLASPPIVQAIVNTSVGTTMVNLNNTVLKNLLIPLPPNRAEQEAIAGALADADAWIESLEKLIAKKRQIKLGVMQQLLTGKRRLPEFASTGELAHTDMGAYPVEWRMSTVGREFSIQLGKMIDAEKNVGRACAYVGNRAVQWGRIDNEGIGMLRLTDSDRSKYRLRRGDLLVCEGGEVGRATIWNDEVEECYFQKAIHRLRPVSACRSEFLLEVLTLYASRGLLNNFVTQTSIAHLPKDKFQIVPIPIPSPEEQDAIVATLAAQQAEISELDRKLATARHIKQGMMQTLLTGRVRLVSDEGIQRLEPKPVPATEKSHNWQINEAVVIAVLAKLFGSEQYPLGRKRYTKLSYLLHRHVERKAEGYLKKAAGPYNPSTKYGGPEKIATRNKYIRQHKRGNYEGFVTADEIAKAEVYFDKWYGEDAKKWLDQFRFTRNDDLELLATVDMAMEDLRFAGRPATVDAVKNVLQSNPEWLPKLDRDLFADNRIADAIVRSNELFGVSGSR